VLYLLAIQAKKEMVMKKSGILTLLIALCFVSFSFPQTAEELIQQADQICLEMKDMATAKKAEVLYLQASSMLDDKYDAYWKVSRILYYIGEHTENKKEKKGIFDRGVYYAEKAVELEPEKPDGHYWLGVNYGKVGETRGVLKSLSLVKPIKNAMNKVIELDRSYEDGGPDRVLGRVFYKLPGIAGGSKDKSLEHLLKSKEYGPEDAVTRIYLAETYVALKEKEKAREELEYVMNMEPDNRWFYAIDENKEVARELLNSKKLR
jgi:tetratricopeptide (TPR) repeat protein